MNYEQANAVKELAEPVNKVLERLEWECPKCNGDGFRQIYPSGYGGRGLECRKCNGKKKVKYSHTPQVGEWCFDRNFDGCPRIIVKIDLEIEESLCTSDDVWVNPDCQTPILEWEEIEGMLEKAGYETEIYDMVAEDGEYIYCIWLAGPENPCYEGRGKSRQEAVMKAAIELGKEIKQ